MRRFVLSRAHYQQVAQLFNLRVERFVPHSFLLVVLFTFLIYLLGIFIAYRGPFDMVRLWINGFWDLLSFTMQMVLLVMAGSGLASSPAGRRALRFLAGMGKTGCRAVIFLTVMTSLVAWVHWSLGLIAGAFLAREMGRRVPGADYPILVAGAFIGMCAGNFGPGAFVLGQEGGVAGEGSLVPFGLGSFSPPVLAGFLGGTAAASAFLGLVCPSAEKAEGPDGESVRCWADEDRAGEVQRNLDREFRQRRSKYFGAWLEHSRWPLWLIFLMGFSFWAAWFLEKGFFPQLNQINFGLLLLALLLHDTPLRFLGAMERSARMAYGLILQFPFYAGLQSMAAGSGVAAILSGWSLSFSSTFSVPVRAFLGAVVLNFFLPLSNDLWQGQGAALIQAAQSLQSDFPRAIHSLKAGETIGDLLQPLWALPFLGICGLPIRRIAGYALMAFPILSLVWILCLMI